jgi:hypothetical protein
MWGKFWKIYGCLIVLGLFILAGSVITLIYCLTQID